MKRIIQGKLAPFYDEFGYATNLFILPSLEDIIKFVQNDYDTNQNLELENGCYEKLPKFFLIRLIIIVINQKTY
jgi:hypothetical protein